MHRYTLAWLKCGGSLCPRQTKYENILRRLRARIFDYDDGSEGEKRIQHLMERCKVILRPYWEKRHEIVEKARTDRMMHLWT